MMAIYVKCTNEVSTAAFQPQNTFMHFNRQLEPVEAGMEVECGINTAKKTSRDVVSAFPLQNCFWASVNLSG